MIDFLLLAQQVAEGEPPETHAETGSLLALFGRMHLVLLHLPFGTIGALVLSELMAWRWPQFQGVRRAMAWAAFASCALAVASGLVLHEDGGYDHDLVERHEAFALGLAFLTLLYAVFGGWMSRSGRLGGGVRALALVLIVNLVALAGHVGGVLTHGRNHVQEVAPEGIRALLDAVDAAVLPTVAKTQLDEAAVAEVQALLEQSCIECHGPNKQKGDLRLDTAEGLRSVVVPGDPGDSELVRRIMLPADDEDAMPTEGELTPQERSTLIEWVRSGAPMT